MPSYALLIFVFLTSSNLGTQGSRILALFPFPSVSHSVVLHTLTLELAQRGHDLVVFTANPVNTDVPPNYKQVDLSYLKQLKDKMPTPPIGTIDVWFSMNSFMDFSIELVDEVYAHPEMARIIAPNSPEKFDLIIIEWILWKGLAGLSHKLDAPLIGMLTMTANFVMHYYLGNPLSASYIPDFNLPYTDRMNFWERSVNLYYNLRLLHTIDSNLEDQDVLSKKYLGSETPHVRDIARNLSLLFSYSDPVLYYPQPIVPTIVEIAGIHLRNKKDSVPLPEGLQKFLDEADQGFIYFSLGSTISGSTMPERTRNEFLKAFAELPYRVLWKWENETLVGKPKNVFISKWLPQCQILAHPNIRVFMYQGGIQSTEEAILYAVPVIGIPMFADQAMNVKKMQSAGIGKMIETKLDSLAKDEVKAALLEIITDKTYKERMMKFRELRHDKPQDVLDKAVWWTEYVIRHKGAGHLRVRAIDMPWYQLLYLDLAAAVLSVLLLVSILLYVTTRYVIRQLFTFGDTNRKKIKTK